MQSFDDKGRQAFYSFWDDMTRRCPVIKYVEIKVGADGEARSEGKAKKSLD